MIKKFIAAALIVAGLMAGAASVAFADPDFGPGNSGKGPHDPGARCHPPGQTADLPECK